MNARIHVCPACGGDGIFCEVTGQDPLTGAPISREAECACCGGTGEVETEVEPIEMEDLAFIEAEIRRRLELVKRPGMTVTEVRSAALAIAEDIQAEMSKDSHAEQIIVTAGEQPGSVNVQLPERMAALLADIKRDLDALS